MTDLRQGTEYATYMKGLGWIVERIGGVSYFIRKIPIVGSVLKIQRPQSIQYDTIELLSKKYRVFQIILEPKKVVDQKSLAARGYHQSINYFAPSKTLRINLEKTVKKLLSEMHYKTRYNIKKGGQKGLVVKKSNDILMFADFWQRCANDQRDMYLSQKREIVGIYKAFGQNSYITTVTKNRALVSAVLMIKSQNVGHYMFAAATNDGKKDFAPTINAWKTIILAKKLGCKFFDFEGIYDNRFPQKDWIGFTRFKKSFGGKEIKYPGCYTKLRFPFL